MVVARIPPPRRFSPPAVLSRAMALSSGRGNAPLVPSSYTTLRERATCEREIKKSKFLAVASHVVDERAAHSFLSQKLRKKYIKRCLLTRGRKKLCAGSGATEIRTHNGDFGDRKAYCGGLDRKIKEISFKVRDPKATHNCWAYKLGDHYRCNDDGEPSGTAGKPIYSAICSSGLDMIMVVVIRYFGGIKLGTGGLVRAYGGVTSECLKDATTCFIKSKIPIGLEVPFDLLGPVYHQIQSFHVEDIKQDYDTGKDGFVMVTFRVDYDKLESLETAISTNCSREIAFYKH